MSQDLIDFAILPQHRVQNYENQIEEQNSTIESLNKKVIHFESLLDKPEEGIEGQSESENTSEPDGLIPPEPKTSEQSVNDTKVDLSSKEEKQEPSDNNPPVLVKDKEEGVAPEISKGKNINRQCLAQQLKEKLGDTNYNFPDNIDKLLAAAVGTSKKPIDNEEQFYQTIISHNLISLVKNSNKWAKYIRPGFFKI